MRRSWWLPACLMLSGPYSLQCSERSSAHRAPSGSRGEAGGEGGESGASSGQAGAGEAGEAGKATGSSGKSGKGGKGGKGGGGSAGTKASGTGGEAAGEAGAAGREAGGRGGSDGASGHTSGSGGTSGSGSGSTSGTGAGSSGGTTGDSGGGGEAGATEASGGEGGLGSAGDAGAGGSGGGVVLEPGTCLDGSVARPIVSATVGDLKLTEVMQDPSLPVGDALGEWFELQATADVDLNGLRVAVGGQEPKSLVPEASDCLHLAAGGFAVFARSAAPENGLPGSVTVAGSFTVRLSNSPSNLQLWLGSTVLDQISWTSAALGVSLVVDGDGSHCSAPIGTPMYSLNNFGTPGQPNFGECP